MRNRLLLFAKRPLPGKVKTRLVPPLDPAQALALYRAFLTDQIRFLRSLRGPSLEAEVCTDAPWRPDPEFAGMLEGLRLSEQGQGDLGQRMLRAFRRAASDGVEGTVVVGVDSPTLPEAHVRLAFSRLEQGAEAVLAPARDGGYVLLGLRQPREELFRGVPWGEPGVLAATRERAAEAGIPLVELPDWYDVDDEDGLTTLKIDLTRDATASRASATAGLLSTLGPPPEPG